MFVFSPSNMMSFKTCPRRFQGQSITKEIEWKSTNQKSRGILVHNVLGEYINRGEDILANGYVNVSPWPDGVNQAYLDGQLQRIYRAKLTPDFDIGVEFELCMNGQGKATGWWDDDCAIRARADLFVKRGSMGLLVDFKTGKKYDTEDFQLRTEAMLAAALYNLTSIQYEYWYVDSGETVANGIQIDDQGWTKCPAFKDIFQTMQEMSSALETNTFVSKRNKFCRWCDFYRTPQCGETVR